MRLFKNQKYFGKSDLARLLGEAQSSVNNRINRGELPAPTHTLDQATAAGKHEPRTYWKEKEVNKFLESLTEHKTWQEKMLAISPKVKGGKK